jgi:hypothetical protein
MLAAARRADDAFEDSGEAKRLERQASQLAAEGDHHALVSSAGNVGDATYVLPIVSTLTFGFAVAELLAQTRGQ